MEYFCRRKFIERINKYLANELFHIDEVVNDEANFYTYYVDIIKNQNFEKWEEEYIHLESFISSNNIDITGKNILDISGGPGLKAKYLSKKARYVAVTEFAYAAANAIKSHLGIDAVKYDYNTDSLSDCVDRKFDIILIAYSINFCNNLDKLAKECYSIMNEGGKIYISFVPPTLGCCLRWQHDEYTYNNLYVPESLSAIFCRNGFTEILRDTEGNYMYNKGYSGTFGEKSNFWPMLYRKKKKKFATLNRELIQKNRILVFKKEYT
jgi:2-polyprenyl-3-methyl-5-hydroxy-6-metoxy-1,4-benzoquinol methylase